MRRFSQRSALVTLSEINITPLLDLAFVLLIIFIITTPLLEQGLNLKLPQGGQPDNAKLDPRNIRTIDISQNGMYKFQGLVYTASDSSNEKGNRELKRASPSLGAWRFSMRLSCVCWSEVGPGWGKLPGLDETRRDSVGGSRSL